MAVKLSALRAGRSLPPPPEDSWYSFLLEAELTPRAVVRLEGLDKLEKFSDLIGIRTHDLPACSIIPQPTALPRTPWKSQFMGICIRCYIMHKYGVQFESWPIHWLSWLEFVVVFLSSSRKLLGCLILGHGHYKLHRFFSHSTLTHVVRVTGSIVKQTTNRYCIDTSGGPYEYFSSIRLEFFWIAERLLAFQNGLYLILYSE
jgi:hypothetical protein